MEPPLALPNGRNTGRYVDCRRKLRFDEEGIAKHSDPIEFFGSSAEYVYHMYVPLWILMYSCMLTYGARCLDLGILECQILTRDDVIK